MAIGIRIDYKKTKYAVEKMFEDYELLKFRLSDDNLPKMTSSFNLVYSSPSGKPKSKVESFVEKREELAKQLDAFWIYVKFLDTFFRTNSSHLLLFQFPFD